MTDRLIKIYAGTSEVPYLVSQAALCNASEYFVKAIKNEHMGKDNIGVLRFPEDDGDAWQVILFWVVKERLPSIDQFPGSSEAPLDRQSGGEDVQMNLYQSWILADKYLMPKLQNAIMRKLLSNLEVNYQGKDSAERALQGHTPSSIIGRLASEGLVERLYGGHNGENPEFLNSLDGVPGAVLSIATALENFCRTSVTPDDCEEFRKSWPNREEPSEVWKEFMVPE